MGRRGVKKRRLLLRESPHCMYFPSGIALHRSDVFFFDGLNLGILFFRFFAELFGIKIVVMPTLVNQFGMATLLNNLAMIQNENLGGILNRAEAVSDNYAGTPVHQMIHTLLNQMFSDGI